MSELENKNLLDTSSGNAPDSKTQYGDEAEYSHEEQSHHGHGEHHRRHRRRSKIKSALYYMLSFFLAADLFFLSVFLVVFLTVFQSDHMIGIMRSDGYYSMVSSELQSRMEDLCDASGFNREFAEKFVKGYDTKKAVEDYVSSFYNGNTTLVDTTAFKQELYSAVDRYTEEKNIEVSDETRKNISYFVDEAAQIYVDQISIPFFSTIANYIENTRVTMNIIISSLAVFGLVIIGIILFTNNYRHRRYRYLFIGFAGATVCSAILPAFVLISGKLRKVNLTDRSLYNLFVDYFSSIFYQMYIWTGILFFISGILIYLYIRHYRRVLNS